MRQEPRFSQRSGPVQPLGEDPRCQGTQLVVAAGLRHRRVPQVIADLEVLVVSPGRAEDMQWRRPHDLAVPNAASTASTALAALCPLEQQVTLGRLCVATRAG